MAWFLDGLKAEDGSTVSTSKSAMFSEPAYSEDLNKVISRLTMDIAGNKANRRSGNCNKHGGKKQKYSVNEVGIDDSSPPSKPSKNPPGVTAHTRGMKLTRRNRIKVMVRLLLMRRR